MNKKVLILAAVAIGAVLLAALLFKSSEDKHSESGPQPTVSSGQVKNLYEQAAGLNEQGRLVDAREAYQDILSNYPDYENIEAVQEGLETVNMKILFSNAETPETVIHEVEGGDTLGKLAKQYNTTVDLIKKSNNLTSDVIRLGQKLRIWKAPFDILVDKSQNMLIVKTGGQVLKVYQVSTGSNNITPIGNFTIVTKLEDPVWYKSGAVIPPESPENALGSRWMGFDLPGYGIHGTIEPETIGQQVTAGCVRMRNQDVEELYSYIPTGTQVRVQD